MKGVSVEVVKLNIISPLPMEQVISSIENQTLLAVEELLDEGSTGRRILSELLLSDIKVDSARLLNLGNDFIPHGNINDLIVEYGLDATSIASAIMEECVGEKKNESAAV